MKVFNIALIVISLITVSDSFARKRNASDGACEPTQYSFEKVRISCDLVKGQINSCNPKTVSNPLLPILDPVSEGVCDGYKAKIKISGSDDLETSRTREMTVDRCDFDPGGVGIGADKCRTPPLFSIEYGGGETGEPGTGDYGYTPPESYYRRGSGYIVRLNRLEVTVLDQEVDKLAKGIYSGDVQVSICYGLDLVLDSGGCKGEIITRTVTVELALGETERDPVSFIRVYPRELSGLTFDEAAEVHVLVGGYEEDEYSIDLVPLETKGEYGALMSEDEAQGISYRICGLDVKASDTVIDSRTPPDHSKEILHHYNCSVEMTEELGRRNSYFEGTYTGNLKFVLKEE